MHQYEGRLRLSKYLSLERERERERESIKEAVREKEEEESKGGRASASARFCPPPSQSPAPISGMQLVAFPCLSGGPSLERQEGGRELGGRERFLSCLHFNDRWEVVLSQRVLLETP